jgi:hypothetical protein
VVVWFYGCPVLWFVGRVAGLKDFQMVGCFSGNPFICLTGIPETQPYKYK